MSDQEERERFIIFCPKCGGMTPVNAEVGQKHIVLFYQCGECGHIINMKEAPNIFDVYLKMLAGDESWRYDWRYKRLFL